MCFVLFNLVQFIFESFFFVVSYNAPPAPHSIPRPPQEIKECAITSMGLLLAHLASDLKQQLPEVFSFCHQLILYVLVVMVVVAVVVLEVVLVVVVVVVAF